MDLTYIEKFTPYADYSEISKIDFQNEIEILSKEMTDINIHSIPFDKYDYIAVFTTAMLEVAGDFILGDPKKGLSKQLSDKNSNLGGFFNKIHENINHSNQPMDYQGFKFGGGDHRGRTFGHDLLMFPIAIYMLCSGKFIDGYYTNNKMNWVISQFNQYGKQYAGMPLDKAIIEYLLHMFADFFSSKSLPVPGFGVLAHFPNREIRVLVNKMYKDGFNLRHMIVQGIPVLTAEILIRFYFYLRYRNLDLPSEMKKHKLNKMLLMTHGISSLVNIGKVIITKNPASINLPMITRVMILAWKVVKEELELTHKSILKTELSVLKNKYETLETIVLLDKAIYYTNQIDLFIAEQKDLINLNLKNATLHRENNISNLRQQLNELKKINQK